MNFDVGIMMGMYVGLFIFSIVTTIISIVCVAIVIGFKNSTHQIEYRDVNFNEDLEEGSDPYNPFAKGEKDPFASEESVPAKNQEKENVIDPLELRDQRKREEAKEQRELKRALVGEDDQDYF
jgi:hypothetical protein